MIGTAKKPFDEILAALKGFQKIGMVGCDGCAGRRSRDCPPALDWP